MGMTMTGRLNHDSLLFRRQFIAGSTAVRPQDAWTSTKFANWYVSCHPDLASAVASAGNTELLGLGHILDPADPSIGTDEILGRVAAGSTTFESFERAVSALGGRWLIFARIANELRLYPDAAGTKPAFYLSSSTPQNVWIASQPRLLSELLDVPIDPRIAKEFLGSKYKNSWPGEVTPYVNVRQLLPNHYLDMKAGAVHRFWPKGQIASFAVDAAAEQIRSIIHGSIASACNRKRVWMPLTGGYDSRTLFACAGALRREMSFFTVVDPDTEYHDVAIPKKLTRKFKVDYHVLRTRPTDDEFRRLYMRNTSYMVSDPSHIKVYTYLGKFEGVFILTGLMAEIGRCFYYSDGDCPQTFSADSLAALSGYQGNPVALRSFANWLAGVPGDTNVNVLDLFFWEHRLGNWAATMATGKDMVSEIIQPFNCRRSLETALGVDVSARREPYYLFRKILEIAEPGTLSLPFNTSFIERTLNVAKKVVPWRCQSFIFRQRMRLAGLPYSESGRDAMASILEDRGTESGGREK